MTASIELIFFPVWALPETAMGVLCDCLMGASPSTLHDSISLLVQSKVLHPPQMTNSTASCSDRKKHKTNGMYLGCPGHVVSGMFHGVVANRRQPNLYIYIYILGELADAMQGHLGFTNFSVRRIGWRQCTLGIFVVCFSEIFCD